MIKGMEGIRLKKKILTALAVVGCVLLVVFVLSFSA